MTVQLDLFSETITHALGDPVAAAHAASWSLMGCGWITHEALLALHDAAERKRVQRDLVQTMQGGTLVVDEDRGMFQVTSKGVTVSSFTHNTELNLTWQSVWSAAAAWMTPAVATRAYREHQADIADRTAWGIELVKRATRHPDGAAVMCVRDDEDPTPGWMCWMCGKVEVNEAWLNLNHGLNSSWPRWDAVRCARQELLASQARTAAEREVRR